VAPFAVQETGPTASRQLCTYTENTTSASLPLLRKNVAGWYKGDTETYNIGQTTGKAKTNNYLSPQQWSRRSNMETILYYGTNAPTNNLYSDGLETFARVTIDRTDTPGPNYTGAQVLWSRATNDFNANM
jgi:hypothetical protein